MLREFEAELALAAQTIARRTPSRTRRYPQAPASASPANYLGGKLWTFAAKTLPTRVAVFCPQAALSLREVEVLVYAHGLLNGCKRPKIIPAGMITDVPFKLGDIVAASGRPIVLVVPYLDWTNPGGESAFGRERRRWHALGKPAYLNSLVAEVLAELGRVQSSATPALRNLVIAGHSRAYDFLEPLAHAHADPQMQQGALARLSEVWAFDSTYAGNVSKWLSWLKVNPGLKASIFYRPGSATETVGNHFYRRRSERLKVVPVREGHCLVPATRLPALLKQPALATDQETAAPWYAAEFEDEDYADHLLEAEASDTRPLPVPVGNPVPFAPPPPLGSYWPVRTARKDARVVSYMYQAPSGIVGQAGRMFLAGRKGKRNGQEALRWHAGIDLFANRKDVVVACEDGTIIDFSFFYAAKSGQRTYKLLIQHDGSGVVVNYGEVTGDSLSKNGLHVGMRVAAGQPIGFVSDTAMLHFETYIKGTTASHQWWKDEKTAPRQLLNPTRYLLFLREHGLPSTQAVGAQPASSQPAATAPKLPAEAATRGALDRIVQVAAQSAIARYPWRNRGVAPPGYIKGMALVYARVYCKLKAGDAAALEMAKANTGNPVKDALAHYAAEFKAAGMNNQSAGVDTLRHLFVLLMGLGMRESSGRYCEGRDTSASNTTAETAEAGLFQTSYNARRANPLMLQVFRQYLANPSGFVEVFREGVRCRKANLENFGEGDGREFQRLSKACPAFAAEFAAVGLRNVRRHWGPINRKVAEIRPECDAMLMQVQKVVDEFNLCTMRQ
ncbi:MAG: M23 family metallopeptidase [Caldilineaceae bacterium]